MTVTVGRKKWILILGAAAVGVTVLLAVLLGLTAGGFGAGLPQLTFSSAAEEFLYDGQAHGGSQWELTGGSLPAGVYGSRGFPAGQNAGGDL